MSTLIFYNCIIFCSVFFIYLATVKKIKISVGKKSMSCIRMSTIFWTLSFLIPLIVIVLRDESVGIDYKAHIDLYNRILSKTTLASDNSWISFGYIFLSKLCIIFWGDNYYYFFCLIGFVTLYCFFKTIYEQSDSPWMSVLLLFSFCLYYQMFNQFRQMLAVAIIFYGFKYIKNRDLRKYLFIILIAFSMHKSAIIMLPCYWINNLKWQKKGIKIYFILSVLAYFLYDTIELVLLKTSYGQTYLTNSYYNVVKESSMINLVFRIFLFLFCYYFTRKIKENYENNILKNLCFCCVVFQILTIKSYIFGRVTTYFFVYFILWIPKAVKEIKISKNSYIIKNIVYIAMCIIYHYTYFVTKASSGFGVGIYKFFFTK